MTEQTRGGGSAARTPDEIMLELENLEIPTWSAPPVSGSPEFVAAEAAEQEYRDRRVQLFGELHSVTRNDTTCPEWAKAAAHYTLIHFRDSASRWRRRQSDGGAL